jgi:hypothetical protein
MIIESIDDLKLKDQERGFIFGQSRTGKSELAKRLIPSTGNLAIIDPKREFDYVNVNVYNDVDKIINSKAKEFIYRPHELKIDNLEDYNKLYQYIYNTGNFFVYTDEIVTRIKGRSYPKFLQVCYQLGGSRNVRMLTTSQRPSCIPMFLMSEANKFYGFRLTLPADAKRVTDFLNPIDDLKTKHHFHYRDIYSMDYAVQTKLNLRGK